MSSCFFVGLWPVEVFETTVFERQLTLEIEPSDSLIAIVRVEGEAEEKYDEKGEVE